jgi:UDP-glucose 4-epimerase
MSSAATVKTALVTGGAGFLGSHLIDRLLGDGTRVVVVDDLSTGRRGRVAEEAELEVLDVVDFEALRAIAESVKPDAVFHLAAQAVVTVSVRDPWFDCDVNVKGTLNVLQAAREQGCPVVFTSTGGALYGAEAPIPTPESQPPAPLAPYGASKWAAEAYVQTWSAASGVPHTVCRLGNVYGPRQSPDGEAGVVAIISRKLWAGEAPTLFGFGKPTRDYVHAHDVAEALVRAVGTAGVFNIATGRESTVQQLFDLIRAEAGSQIEPELAELREGELERSGLETSAAAEAFDWRPVIQLERGVPQTYRALTAEFDAAEAPSSG